MSIARKCRVCGTVRVVPPSKSKRMYCSRPCFYKARYGQFRIPTVCQQCGDEFKTNKWKLNNSKSKFCSFKCRCLFQMRRIPCKCHNCGIAMESKKSQHWRHRTHFCSIGCMHKFHRGENHPRFNPSFAYGPDWRAVARSVRIRDKVCQRCGKTEAENKRRLDVHHKIPFIKFGITLKHVAHGSSNLVALCRSCHKYVEVYGI